LRFVEVDEVRVRRPEPRDRGVVLDSVPGAG
jgi:hypothetical protein